MLAAESGRPVEPAKLSVCSLLLRHGAETSLQSSSLGYTALEEAATRGDERVVELLLQHGALQSDNDKGGTALMCAVMNGHERVADLLI